MKIILQREITTRLRIGCSQGKVMWIYDRWIQDETQGGPPFSAKVRRLSPEMLKIAKQEFKFMLEKGICRPSNSPRTSSLHMVKKKDGSWRLCGGYRALNAITRPDRYTIPHLHDLTH
ncbi:reverse transcriptase domain-containing protein [Trichonephila clavipes]|nr:reverse transcriptase domain-containing protein [Trichonephila clavipes]